MTERRCRICRKWRECDGMTICSPCAKAIGPETHDALYALEMRLRSGRDVPSVESYIDAWQAARVKAGKA